MNRQKGLWPAGNSESPGPGLLRPLSSRHRASLAFPAIEILPSTRGRQTMKKQALIAALAITLLSSASSLAEYMNPIDFPQSGDPTDVQVVIEIPAGSFTKYELDAK